MISRNEERSVSVFAEADLRLRNQKWSCFIPESDHMQTHSCDIHTACGESIYKAYIKSESLIHKATMSRAPSAVSYHQ